MRQGEFVSWFVRLVDEAKRGRAPNDPALFQELLQAIADDPGLSDLERAMGREAVQAYCGTVIA